MKMSKFIVAGAAALLLAGCLETTTTGAVGFLPDGSMLSPDDQIIWAGMTAAQRLNALPYIENGGTIVSSLGAN